MFVKQTDAVVWGLLQTQTLVATPHTVSFFGPIQMFVCLIIDKPDMLLRPWLVLLLPHRFCLFLMFWHLAADHSAVMLLPCTYMHLYCIVFNCNLLSFGGCADFVWLLHVFINS